MAMSSTGIKAIVKSIVSGDTLVLTSSKPPPPGQQAKERILSLAFVTAPRLRREGDEAYAFQSREFLRRNLVGREVIFQVLYSVPQINREYGLVTVQNGPSVLELAVAEGMVKVREDAGKRDDQSDHEPIIDRLKALESKARLENKGLWAAGDEGQIENKSDYPPDPATFLEEWKGKTIDGIVERVISGDRVAIRLLLTSKEHQQVVVLIAGIRAPQTKRTDKDGQESGGEEFGEEARIFIESRLLQRSVKVDLLGLTPQNQFVAQVLHPKGSIAEFILAAGFARCIDFHSSMLGASMGKLREEESKAKAAKLNLWRGLVTKKKDDSNSFDAVVTRIQSGDTIFVRTKAGVEKKISLSSVRAPPRPAGHNDPKVPSQWQAEAKEFLRKKLIGKHVHVSIDGKRPATEGFDEREMGTVTFANQNVALEIIEAGLGTCTKHKRDDTDRSPIWDELNAAEVTATNEKRGMHNPKAPPPKPIVDASESETKAKSHLAFLQRSKRIPAVVDYVASGSRFKLLIPRENVKLTFVLSGIRAPRTARNPSEKSEPFGPEALEFTSRRTFQRDVEIDVENIDKANGFIGTMYVNRENLAKLLVEEGLSSVHSYSAEQSGHGPQLFAAEKSAKEARKNMWQSWTPEDDDSEEVTNTNGGAAENVTYSKKQDYKDVVVTNVDEVGKLKVQIIGAGTTGQLEKMMADFKSFHLSKSNATPIAGPPRVGDIVAAEFSADKAYYRARVRHVDREGKKADVLYIDYGNSEIVPWTSLRPLTQPQFSTTKLKAQAVDAVLSFIQFPGAADYAKEAQEFLLEHTGDRELVGNIDFTEKDGTLSLSLFDQGSANSDDTINGDMIAMGLAMIPKKTKPWEKAYNDKITILKKKQEQAIDEKRGMWEYGDITED